MSVLTISPAEYYPGAVVSTHQWKETNGKISRSIRADVAIDNTVVVTDSGFSWGHTSFSLLIPYSDFSYQTLNTWLQAWPQVTVARIDGLFQAIIKSIRQNLNKIVIELSIIERIS
ncbi:MAG: hypothetical protein KAG12_07760 [Desulfuromusa sp.]|nr:hypothetical protein [Desulfuromusa sp.]